MCGRYVATAGNDELIEQLEIEEDHTGEATRSLLRSPQSPPPNEPDYNMAPTKNARVVVARAPRRSRDGASAAADGGGTAAADLDAQGPRRQLRLLTWGLVPSWSKDPSGSARMANVRVESAATKPAFRAAFKARRALVPADGWYEWQASPVALDAKGRPRKQPFYMQRGDGAPLAFGGLYEFWRDPAAPAGQPGAWLASFTILTQPAEPGLDRIHDRQPVVIDPDHWDAWLTPSTDPAQVQSLLTASPPGRFAAYPVGRAVGNSRNNGPALLEPAEPGELVGVVDPATGEVLSGEEAGFRKARS